MAKMMQAANDSMNILRIFSFLVFTENEQNVPSLCARRKERAWAVVHQSGEPKGTKGRE